MKVLIMNGASESGKGTVVGYLKELFTFNIEEYSSIDYVKQVAIDSFHWDEQKDTEGRNLLAAIKQLMIAYNDLPITKVIYEITQAILFKVDIFVVDIREPDEIEKLVNHCKKCKITCHTCRVFNVKAEKKAELSELSLTGDRLYGEYIYDINIYNNRSLNVLKDRVATIFDELYKEI